MNTKLTRNAKKRRGSHFTSSEKEPAQPASPSFTVSFSEIGEALVPRRTEVVFISKFGTDQIQESAVGSTLDLDIWFFRLGDDDIRDAPAMGILSFCCSIMRAFKPLARWQIVHWRHQRLGAMALHTDRHRISANISLPHSRTGNASQTKQNSELISDHFGLVTRIYRAIGPQWRIPDHSTCHETMGKF